MNRYEARRTKLGPVVVVNGCPLNPCLHVRNHSPNGFEWGYGGSGPAQLALAILVHHLGDEEQALGLYQQFKFAVVAKLPWSAWTLTDVQIQDALSRIQKS